MTVNRWGAAAYVAPALLVLVALVQLRSAHQLHLSPWKGGGFGMFSTIDRISCRVLVARLTTADGTFPIRLSESGGLSRSLDLAIASPSRARLRAIARQLDRRDWFMDSLPTAGTQLLHGRDCTTVDYGGHEVLSVAMNSVNRHAVERSPQSASASTQESGLTPISGSISVEVLRIHFNSKSRELSLKRLAMSGAEE